MAVWDANQDTDITTFEYSLPFANIQLAMSGDWPIDSLTRESDRIDLIIVRHSMSLSLGR